MMTTAPSRRTLLIAGVSAVATAACARPAKASPVLEVHRSPSCGCCGAWISHMREAGFETRVVATDDPGVIRRAGGLPDTLAACHTALIGGYVIEGHVPAADVRRLLAERPAAAGLAVPAMPMGSPGMETPDGRVEPYDTLLVLRSGGTRVFARHG